jgi:hypothetical protein
VNKIPTNFDTLFVTSLYDIWLFKGLNARHIYMSFGVKGLNVDWLWSDISCISVQITQNFILSQNYTKQGKGFILTGITVKCGTVVAFILLVYTWNVFYLLITWKTDFLNLELLYKSRFSNYLQVEFLDGEGGNIFQKSFLQVAFLRKCDTRV